MIFEDISRISLKNLSTESNNLKGKCPSGSTEATDPSTAPRSEKKGRTSSYRERQKAGINYLLTYDSYGPVHNRFHRGEWITWGSGGRGPWTLLGP